jgi:hypothetical protein
VRKLTLRQGQPEAEASYANMVLRRAQNSRKYDLSAMHTAACFNEALLAVTGMSAQTPPKCAMHAVCYAAMHVCASCTLAWQSLQQCLVCSMSKQACTAWQMGTHSSAAACLNRNAVEHAPLLMDMPAAVNVYCPSDYSFQCHVVFRHAAVNVYCCHSPQCSYYHSCACNVARHLRTCRQG